MQNPYKIYFWKYHRQSRNYYGHHLSADKNGCDFLLQKLNLRLEKPFDRPVRFNLLNPTDSVLSVPGYSSKAKSWKSLEILIDYKAPDSYLNISIDNDIAQISVSSENAKALISGVTDIRSGDGDYCMIGHSVDNTEKQNIWFWWQTKA